jgi:glycosyltransferase involved in cell wall biosynthesis
VGSRRTRPLVAIDYTPAVRQNAGIGRIIRGQIDALLALDPPLDIRLFVVGRLTAAERAATPRPLAATPLSERNMVRWWHRLNAPLPTIDAFLGARPDLLHATDFVLPPTRTRRKLLTVHDLAFLYYPEAAMPGLQRYLNVVVPRSVARADFLIADSANTAQDLTTQWRVPAEEIAVVYGAIDPLRFHPVSDPDKMAAVRAKYNLGSAPYILTLSRLEPRKNHLRLIEAFARARAVGIDHHLVIGGGKGWLYDEIFARVNALDLGDAVHFTGFVEDADLPALYSAATFFAYPSLYEGFGLPVVEALACGLPVLAGDNSCLPEAGGPGALYVNALDVDAIAQSILTMVANPALRAALAEAGAAHAARFTWERSARALLSVYTNALAA